jgi:D-3-phosphoglycerate dehydrogenase
VAVLRADNAHWDRDRCRGEELAGMAVGIIGCGRVGRRVAHYLAAFDADVLWFDIDAAVESRVGRRVASLDRLIADSRVVVLAASHESRQPPIVDHARVQALAGKHFVNVARGELVDEDALLAAVKGGKLAGCALDVLCGEPDPPNLAAWIAASETHNVILTPHIGGATFKSMQATEEFLAERLIAHLASAEVQP